MKVTANKTTNILLTLPDDLNKKLQREAAAQERKRHAQIIFILQKFFQTPDGNGKKEKTK